MGVVSQLLAAYDRVLGNVITTHELVVMDTPEDRELHARAITEFRAAQQQLRAAWDKDAR